jgi:hypothetical protein
MNFRSVTLTEICRAHRWAHRLAKRADKQYLKTLLLHFGNK